MSDDKKIRRIIYNVFGYNNIYLYYCSWASWLDLSI